MDKAKINLIYEKNGFIYIHAPDIEMPEWVTTDYDNGDPYFLLNTTTKKLFAEYFIPYLKADNIKINKELYYDMSKFKQNSEHPPDAVIIKEYKGIALKEHQITAISKMLTHNRYGFFYGTGTGKTIIAIFYLLITNHSHIVIVTPKKVIQQYANECQKYLSYKITTLDNTASNTITIINYESLHKLKYKWIDCLILDETQNVKSYTSNANKILRTISTYCTNIYLFTGTPMDKSRHEIFAQLSILDERVMPSKTRFNYRYFNIDDYHQPCSEKRIFKDEITRMILDYTIGVKTTDVVDLPPMHSIEIPCIHPEYHDDIAKDRYLTIDDFDYIADTTTILRTKQQEICSGFILNGVKKLPDKPPELRKTQLLCTWAIKINALKLLIESKTFDKGIIFTNFDEEITIISKWLLGLHVKFDIIDGKTDTIICSKIKDNLFNNKIQFIIANVKCANSGLDMYFINKVLFYSLPDSYIVYHQCCSRIYRIGQTKECYIYHLICKDSVETKKSAALSRKKSFTNKLYSTY